MKLTKEFCDAALMFSALLLSIVFMWFCVVAIGWWLM